MLPYSAAVTPVFAQAAREAAGVGSRTGVDRHNRCIGDRLRCIELDEIRRADRPVIGEARHDILDRCVLDIEFVRVDAAGGAVVRVTEGGTECQLLDKGPFLDQRCVQLEEFLGDVIAVVDGHTGATVAGQVIRQLLLVRRVVQRFLSDAPRPD